MDGQTTLKLPVNGFKWLGNTSQFNIDFTENYNKNSYERYLLEVDFQYPKNLLVFHNDLPFLPKRMEIEKIEKLAANLHDKKHVKARNTSENLQNEIFQILYSLYWAE